jgi:medium-chain acyl-[acyl-carrier-protein] hydrolase
MATIAPSHHSVIRRQGRQVLLRLFCFPYAGRGASIFRTWHNRLQSGVEVFPVQIPGRESRLSEPPFTRLAPLVEHLATALSPHFDVPFAFFGHSMGALISFELARFLRSQRRSCPMQLFVSGHRAPQLPPGRLRLHDLPEPALLQELRQLNSTSGEILDNGELMQIVLPTLRADLALCESYDYRPEEPFDFPIAAFGGLQDSTVSLKDVAQWRLQTRGPFALHMFPGDHFFLHSAKGPYLSTLFDMLQALCRQ